MARLRYAWHDIVRGAWHDTVRGVVWVCYFVFVCQSSPATTHVFPGGLRNGGQNGRTKILSQIFERGHTEINKRSDWLSDAVEPISAKCTRLKNRKDQLMKDNVDLYSQYQTSMRTLGFLNTTISTFLMKKSQDDFKQWSVVLKNETRRANNEEADRLNMLRDSMVS